jgi:ATP-dependent helicase HrpB
MGGPARGPTIVPEFPRAREAGTSDDQQPWTLRPIFFPRDSPKNSTTPNWAKPSNSAAHAPRRNQGTSCFPCALSWRWGTGGCMLVRPVSREPLPIDALLDQIVQTLRASRALVLQADPGAGKTTRVPPALLEAGLAGDGEILVAEPRRLAARLAADRVASELGQAVGGTVGYHVRFEQVASVRTRLRYVTDGVLLRRLIADPLLNGVGLVVLDELHERQLGTDVALALLERAWSRGRADLRLLAMSATLEAQNVARFLGDCPVLSSPGRRYPVHVEHLAKPDDRPLERQMSSAIRSLVQEHGRGDILAFLPGASEIRRTAAALETWAREHELLVVALHGALPVTEQAIAIRPSSQRKVVLSTNVAESSVTVPGIFAVVDCGLARVSRHRPYSGLPALLVEPISRASAEQRAGRAGRTGPGHVLRLYTSSDLARRPEHAQPELLRADLSEMLLILHGTGVRGARELHWLDAPPESAVVAAERLLALLGAVDASGKLTALGRRLLAFPLHPRLGRIVVEGERQGDASTACRVAALLGERDIRRGARVDFAARRDPRAVHTSRSDVLDLLDLYWPSSRNSGRTHCARSSSIRPRSSRSAAASTSSSG